MTEIINTEMQVSGEYIAKYVNKTNAIIKYVNADAKSPKAPRASELSDMNVGRNSSLDEENLTSLT